MRYGNHLEIRFSNFIHKNNDTLNCATSRYTKFGKIKKVQPIVLYSTVHMKAKCVSK